MKKIKAITAFVLSFIICAFLVVPISTISAATTSADDIYNSAPEISAGSAILMDADTGSILYEKNANQKNYPASTTKLLTGLLICENNNLNDTITFSRAAANSVGLDDANLAIKAGEQMTVEQAMYGLLLHSANDIAYGLGEYGGGTLSNFVDMMNARAKELGAKNTHFANASGLYDANHYTTAYDMALIARATFNNSTFLKIDSTPSYTIPATNLTSQPREITHRHLMLKGKKYYYQYCEGGKTGYTEESLYTLVTYAEKDGMRLICVVFQEPDTNVRFTDTRALFDWGYKNFQKLAVSDSLVNSTFSKSNYLTTSIYNDSNISFDFDATYITVPNATNITDIVVTSDTNTSEGTTTPGFLANVIFKYGDHTVGTAALSSSSGNESKDSRLPYVDDSSANSYKPRFAIPINVWLLIAVIAVIVFIYRYRKSRQDAIIAKKRYKRYNRGRRR